MSRSPRRGRETVDFCQSNLGLGPPVNLRDNKSVESRKSRPLASGWAANCARPAAYSLGLVVGLAVRCNCHRVRRRCQAFGARETGRRGAAEILRGLRLPGCRRGTVAGVGSGGQLAVAYLYEGSCSWHACGAEFAERHSRVHRFALISRTRSAPQIARRRLKKTVSAVTALLATIVVARGIPGRRLGHTAEEPVAPHRQVPLFSWPAW